jgi:hypothetical protein
MTLLTPREHYAVHAETHSLPLALDPTPDTWCDTFGFIGRDAPTIPLAEVLRELEADALVALMESVA